MQVSYLCSLLAWPQVVFGQKPFRPDEVLSWGEGGIGKSVGPIEGRSHVRDGCISILQNQHQRKDRGKVQRHSTLRRRCHDERDCSREKTCPG